MVSKILSTLPRGVFGHRIPPTGREQALSAPPRDSQLMHQEPSLPSCLDASCQSFSPLLQSPWFQIQCGLPCLLPDSGVLYLICHVFPGDPLSLSTDEAHALGWALSCLLAYLIFLTAQSDDKSHCRQGN